MAVLCRQCRAEIDPKAKKCRHCGSTQAVTSVPQVLAAFFIVALVVIVVVWWIGSWT